MSNVNGVNTEYYVKKAEEVQNSGSSNQTNPVTTDSRVAAEDKVTVAPDVFDLLAQGAEESEEVQAPVESTPVASTSATNAASTKEELEEKKEKLEEEKEANMKKMEKLEKKIEQKAKDAEEHIIEAGKKREAQVEEYEDDAKRAVREQVNAYVEANKEGGDGMTREQLQQNIAGALPQAPAAAAIIGALTAASEEINEMDNYLSQLNGLIKDTQKLEADISSIDGQIEAAQAAEDAATNCPPPRECTDPIGFNTEDAQYEFIVDDGSFDTTSDFLGANNQWAEMQALDTDGDKTVTADELKAGNIKAVKTGKDGSQEVVDIASEFGDDFSVDLNSYDSNGTFEGLNEAQDLQGTFNVNIAGQDVKGFNTLDDVSYLENKYGITDDMNGASAVTQAAQEATGEAEEISEDLKPHVDFFNLYTEKSAELKEQLDAGYEEFDFSKEEIDGIKQTTKREADVEAQRFMATLDSEDEEEEKVEDKEEADDIKAEEPVKEEAVAEEADPNAAFIKNAEETFDMDEFEEDKAKEKELEKELD